MSGGEILGLIDIGAVFSALTDNTLLLLAGLSVALVLRFLRRWLRPRARNWIAVDGSNVMYWRDGKPDLGTVRLVLAELVAAGYDPVIWFDANVGWLTLGQYAGADRLSPILGMPVKQVIVAAKGQPADPLIISGAEFLGARIVTNDRYRDWLDTGQNRTHPDRQRAPKQGQRHQPSARSGALLIRGSVQAGRVKLDL